MTKDFREGMKFAAKVICLYCGGEKEGYNPIPVRDDKHSSGSFVHKFHKRNGELPPFCLAEGIWEEIKPRRSNV